MYIYILCVTTYTKWKYCAVTYAMALRCSSASAAVLPDETLESRRLRVNAQRYPTCIQLFCYKFVHLLCKQKKTDKQIKINQNLIK